MKITKKVRMRDLAGDFADLVEQYGDNPFTAGLPSCDRHSRTRVECSYHTVGAENPDHNVGTRALRCRIDVHVRSHTRRKPTWKRDAPDCWYPFAAAAHI